MRYRWDPVYPNPGRRTPADADLRASDAERNEVADRLSHHFAEGRLDQVEFKARLDRAIGATTRGDLHGLFDDLPPLEDEPAPARSRRGRLVPFLFIMILAVVAAGATISTVHVPWVLLVLVAVFFWYRGGWHRHHHHLHHDADR